MSETQAEPEECRIEFENGNTRSTAIGFFIECAIEDSEATVFAKETGEKIESVAAVPEVES
jgi:hypothetical protein